MTTISEENKKQFRRPMKISAGIQGNISRAWLSVVPRPDLSIGGIWDYDTCTWDFPIRQLADFSGDGIPLDGSVHPWQKIDHVDESTGKMGIHSTVGNGEKMVLYWINRRDELLPNITLIFSPDSSGTIDMKTVDGLTRASLPIAPRVIVPVNDKEGYLVITNASDTHRVKLYSAIPGITLDFTESEIVSINMSLRSDLSVDSQTIPISEIELKVYWTQDISETIGNITDGATIYYSAGYDGGMSAQRNFYLSEPARMENGLITLHGEDSVRYMDQNKIPYKIMQSYTGNGKQQLYKLFCDTVQSGLSNAKVLMQSAPTGKKTGAISDILIPETDSRTLASDIMHLGTLQGEFVPQFVDAGIPKISWSPQVAKWEIREEDCGDVSRLADRKIAVITSDGEYKLHNTAKRINKWITISTRKTADAGKRYNVNGDDGPYYTWTVSNGKSLMTTPDKCSYIAKKTAKKTVKYYYRKKRGGKLYPCSKKTYAKKKSNMRKKKTVYVNPCITRAKKLQVTGGTKSIIAPDGRPGYTLTINPLDISGLVKTDDGSRLYPRHDRRFEISNITGEFAWKGDPRMQPRDLCKFYHTEKNKHLNDSGKDYELIQIETIEIIHEAGGTQAKITYRKAD